MFSNLEESCTVQVQSAEVDSEQDSKNALNSQRSSSEPVIGAKIADKYVLKEVLGRGASGVVFKAHHILLEDTVAIKFFAQHLLENEGSLERFKQEANLLSSFSHPNIVKFHAFAFNEAKLPYMVLEYIDGEPLSQRIKSKGALTESEAVGIFCDICKALSYSHEKGVIHRDIKPGNIIVRELNGETQALLLDFGIFKSLATSDQNLTKTGLIVGSANYMSPEQCRMQKDLDGRSDIYSMGCLMYEALSGKAPMQAESDLATMNNHLHKSITSVPAVHGISQDLQSIILRCLEKQAERRFASAEELEQALNEAREKPALRRHTNNKMKILAGFAVILALIYSITMLYQSNKKSGTVLRSAIEARSQKLSAKMLARVPDQEANVPACLQQAEDWLKSNEKTGFRHVIRIQAHITDTMARLRLGIRAKAEGLFVKENIDSFIKNYNRAAPSLFGISEGFREGSHQENEIELNGYFAAIQFARDGSAPAEETLRSMLLVPKQVQNPEEKEYLQTLARSAVVGALTKMAYLGLWKDEIAQGEKYARRACDETKMFKHPVENNSEAMVCNATIQLVQGRYEECRKLLAKAIVIANETIEAGNTIDMKETLYATLNAVHMEDTVVEFMQKHFKEPCADSKKPLNLARMKIELARALLLKGRADDCLEVLRDIIDYCQDQQFYSPVSDQAECLYLRALHVSGQDGQISENLNNYLNKVKNTENEIAKLGHSSVSHIRYFQALAYIFCELSLIKQDTRKLQEQVEQVLQSVENDGEKTVPPECCELRLAEGLAARKRGDLREAVGLFQLAAKDCPNYPAQEKSMRNFRSRYLNDLARFKKVQALIELNDYETADKEIPTTKSKNDGSDDDFGHDLEKNDIDAAQGLVFFRQALKLQAKTGKHFESRKYQNQARKLINECPVSISVLDDYSNFVLFLAERELQNRTSNTLGAISTLSTGLEKLNHYQGWRFKERKQVADKLCSILREPDLLKKTTANLEEPEPDISNVFKEDADAEIDNPGERKKNKRKKAIAAIKKAEEAKAREVVQHKEDFQKMGKEISKQVLDSKLALINEGVLTGILDPLPWLAAK